MDWRADVTLEGLGGVALGGIIGLLSGAGLEVLRRTWKAQDDRRRINRLLQLLFEEVEQLAELLAIDLGMIEAQTDRSLAPYEMLSEAKDRQARAAIKRLQENRTIYESQAGRFLELPGYLPNALVRFYTRLQVNCARMLRALDEGNLPRVMELRDVALHEAESLKIDIRNAIHK